MSKSFFTVMKPKGVRTSKSELAEGLSFFNLKNIYQSTKFPNEYFQKLLNTNREEFLKPNPYKEKAKRKQVGINVKTVMFFYQ